MNGELKMSGGSMIAAAVLAIILGFVMLLYPGGTMALMTVAFSTLQAIISIFVLAYAISEAVGYFKAGKTAGGILAILVGIAAALLIWVFDVGIVYLIFALFCIVAGLSEIFGAFTFPAARAFLLLLGLINIMIGAIIIKHPVVLPLLIAWYVLFWGISRLLLGVELKRLAA